MIEKLLLQVSLLNGQVYDATMLLAVVTEYAQIKSEAEETTVLRRTIHWSCSDSTARLALPRTCSRC